MHVQTKTRFFIALVISNLLYVPLTIADEIVDVKNATPVNNTTAVSNVKTADSVNNTKIVAAAELTKIAQHKTYVGVIPYYQVKNKTYILLGRETKDSRKVDAGVYADFGSRVKVNDERILQKASVIISQDTMGKLKISAQDLRRSGKIIYKQINPEHDVYYIFYKVSQQQFLKIKKFNVPHERLKASSLANTNLEMDKFVWFNFDDLLQHTPKEPEVQKTFNVYTIDGKKMTANFRKYFIMDCLQNPELPGLMKSL